MARIACSTWDGGGNVAVFRTLAATLRARGHDVSLQVAWGDLPLLDGDVLLVDHMTTVEGLEAVLESGKRVATVVHTLWSFVPSLEGTFAPAGYLDVLSSFERHLVFGLRELEAGPVPTNVVHVGPLIEDPGSDLAWEPSGRPLVVVSLGTTPMDEAAVLQRVLDALADLEVFVAVTVGSHVDPVSLRVPANARVSGYISHSAMLGHADLFIGHGGHGGIMAALKFGVPVVSIPLGRDQPHNAERLEATGAGRTLAADEDSSTIRATVEASLADASQRAAAQHLARQIAAYDGAAVTEVEAVAHL